MHKELCCACSRKFLLPFPLLSKQLYCKSITFARSLSLSLQSFLPVDCSALLFAPWFHLRMLLTVLSLSLSLSCCGTQLLIIIVQLLNLCLLSVMDLGSVVLVVVTSSFQHFFALVLPILSIYSRVC